jgi:glyoxylase-like metal-dependent hydrolase (beta-lactamase superfamily II)
MVYEYADRADNVYMIDTEMFGFKWFNAAYIITGKEVALIDTGVPTSIDVVRAAINKHGFGIEDISHVFVTHGEHPDHSGNVGTLLQENTRAKVYINPIGAEYLTNPEIESATRKVNLSAEMAARFGEMLPVPASRIQYLNDGDVFDLGNDVRLRIIFAPGHQPSGIVILEEKNKGLFINDLPGQYFEDADFTMMLTPFRMDVIQSIESLKKVADMSVNRLFLGHFGICDKPKQIMENALIELQRLLDIAAECVKKGKPDEIASKVMENDMPRIEELGKARGNALYEYLSKELVPSKSKAFANYYLNKEK